MDDTVWGRYCPEGLEACAYLHMSQALEMKHLVAQFGLTLTSTCLG
jgi:hypothetical protein